MKLVLMGDLHYHEVEESIQGWREARAAFYEALLERFLVLDADFHISLGDLTNYGTTGELTEVFELLRRKERNFIHVLGNHDLYAQTRREVLEITGGKRYHAIETDEVTLVFLDTAKEMDHADWGGWLDDEQLQWLEEVVQASGSKPMLVFGHHPVHQTTTRSERDKGSIHPSIDMWRILRQKEGVGVYFNGHTHVESIVQQENWTFVQLPCCLDQHSFRVVELSEQEIRVTAVDYDDEQLTVHAPTLHGHMPHFSHTPNARGQANERECVIPCLTALNPQ
ncbi:3',5'-cyclic AMP phosphodiesterase CpdA [Paenibacillus phyllosphaerae]|uniref:3',5'-cyclic AMP phosphodiesterase CpdA n=1 Tax=Paenibacillus phyllosphaerae TaxID=274593 RepID=A0A7W5AZ54_9BACL|nr:metallophosphoesterase [Paenibacillus phyllosphaerae]MBB3111465.1 3',5'-cyclic AMP phosphodiesterase CpdA [Paenibacillus phyllosphaerae]